MEDRERREMRRRLMLEAVSRAWCVERTPEVRMLLMQPELIEEAETLLIAGAPPDRKLLVVSSGDSLHEDAYHEFVLVRSRALEDVLTADVTPMGSVLTVVVSTRWLGEDLLPWRKEHVRVILDSPLSDGGIGAISIQQVTQDSLAQHPPTEMWVESAAEARALQDQYPDFRVVVISNSLHGHVVKTPSSSASTTATETVVAGRITSLTHAANLYLGACSSSGRRLLLLPVMESGGCRVYFPTLEMEKFMHSLVDTTATIMQVDNMLRTACADSDDSLYPLERMQAYLDTTEKVDAANADDEVLDERKRLLCVMRVVGDVKNE